MGKKKEQTHCLGVYVWKLGVSPFPGKEGAGIVKGHMGVFGQMILIHFFFFSSFIEV